MDIRRLELDGVMELIPAKLHDARGFFSETYSKAKLAEAGIELDWVQDNQSYSAERFTLRGLHYQIAPFAQDKLIRVLKGSVFDVAIDLREGSPDYGRWAACELSAAKWNQLLVPKDFAHGFLTLEPDTEVFYKVSAPYAPACDRAIRWNDPRIAVDWPLGGATPVVSGKDAKAPLLAEAGQIAF